MVGTALAPDQNRYAHHDPQPENIQLIACTSQSTHLQDLKTPGPAVIGCAAPNTPRVESASNQSCVLETLG
jgi:hypothetical protein